MENNEYGFMQNINPRLGSGAGGFAYSVAVMLFMLTSVIVYAINAACGLTGTDGAVYLSYLASPVALCAGIAITLKFSKVGFKTAFPVKCKPKYYLIALLLIFGLLFAFGSVNTVALKLIKLINPQYEQRTSYLPEQLSGGFVVLAIFVIAVLPAFFEEALFRGVILNACEGNMGTIRTIFVVGFCFSLFHGSPEQTVYQFICGCAFAFLTLRSKSVIPAMIIHFINNALIIILSACNCFDKVGNLLIPPSVNITLTVLGLVSFIGGMVWLILDKAPVLKCAKGGVKNFFVCASLGIIVLAVNWFISLIATGAA